jgi:hypothetical protein
MLLAVCSLAIVGALMTMQGKSNGPTSAAVTNAESQAVATASASVFQPVDQVLQLDRTQTGTYVGAQLPAGTGVIVKQASTSSYCLEANLSGTLVHEYGPGGTPANGPC